MEVFVKTMIAIKNKDGNHCIWWLDIPSSMTVMPVYIRVHDIFTNRAIQAKMSFKGPKSGKFFYEEMGEI